MLPSEILENIVMRRLPHSSQKIVRILGWEGAINFLMQYGGRDVYIPVRINSNSGVRHKLFKKISNERAQRLIDELGGTNIELPLYKTLIVAERNAAILADYRNGRKQAHLVIKYNTSKQHISKLVNRFGIKKAS